MVAGFYIRGSTCIDLLNTVSVAMEAIGDITASAEVSRVAVDGLEFDSRIQGGVLVCRQQWFYTIHSDSRP